MKSISVALTLLSAAFLLNFSACGDGKERPSASQASNTEDHSAAVSGPTKENKQHTLQITVINFLKFNGDKCNVKNQLFYFNTHDKNVKTFICSNSTVAIYAHSNDGVVSFSAVDLNRNKELPDSPNTTKTWVLGKSKEMLRYQAKNPYGFTYVMAEDVSGIEPTLLEQWNKLSEQRAIIVEKGLLAEREGKKLSKKDLKDLMAIEGMLSLLAERMKESQKQAGF